MLKTETVDSVVRTALLDSGLTIHFYLRMLNHALRGLKELHFDYPLNVKTVKLEATTYGAIIAPSDFVDVVSVLFKDGDRIIPLTADASINPLYNYDESGNKVKHNLPKRFNQERHLDDVAQSFTSHTNSHGENIGRYFGYNHGKEFAYTLVRERGELQLSTTTTTTEIYMTYVTDGVVTTAMNTIHPYAVETLKLYCHWKMATYFNPFGRARYMDIQSARREFYNAKRILRARFNEMGLEEIVASSRIVHQGLKN
jgi:hypothetical protein